MLKEINEEIAKYFLVDSLEYLKRYEILKINQTHIGNRSKLLIDLLFSMECSVNALIFLESNTNEKETYKNIRTHNLIKLLQKVNTDELTNIVEKIESNIEHFSISSRYTLEAQIYFRPTNGVLGETYYNTIASFIWLDEMYQCAKKLYDYTNSKIEYLKVVSFNEIDIDRQLEKFKRISEINKK